MSCKNTQCKTLAFPFSPINSVRGKFRVAGGCAVFTLARRLAGARGICGGLSSHPQKSSLALSLAPVLWVCRIRASGRLIFAQHAKRGNYFQFWSAYVPCGAQHLDAVQLALEQIDVIKRLADLYPSYLQLVTTAKGQKSQVTNALVLFNYSTHNFWLRNSHVRRALN